MLQQARRLFVGVLFSTVAVPLYPAQAADASTFPEELDAYVAKAVQDWDIPGAALAIVKDGQVVVAKGYGVRELGKADPVDAATIFDTASLTKAFTAAAIASLVDEKKMSWDAPVRTYLPTLEFSDPYLTANVTLRDLLTHRTAVRNNSAWYFGKLTPAQVLGLFKNLQPEAPFRTQWLYSNIGYEAAGEAAASVAGSTLEKLTTQRILEPLGMKRTTANFDAVPALGNFASPHAVIAGVHRAIPRETTRMSTAAAGAVQTCATDLATWMLFQLGDGTFGGRRILSPEVMAEMHAPQIFVPTTAEFRSRRQIRFLVAYGFGWQVWDYRGTLLLWHTGGGDGQSAYLALLPEIQLGVAVTVNTWKSGGSAFNLAIASRIQDHYLGSPARDYVAEYREAWMRTQKRDADEQRALDDSRLKHTKPSLALAAYAGVYRDRLNLDVDIAYDGKALVLRYAGGQPGRLEHWHQDTFRVRWENPLADQDRVTFATFRIDANGKASDLHLEPFGEKIDATRVVH